MNKDQKIADLTAKLDERETELKSKEQVVEVSRFVFFFQLSFLMCNSINTNSFINEYFSLCNITERCYAPISFNVFPGNTCQASSDIDTQGEKLA